MDTQYPRTVTFEHPKLTELLTKKKKDTIQVAELSSQIDDIQKDMDDVENQIKEFEKTADIKDLDEKAQALTKVVNDAIAEMEVIKKEVYDRCIKVVPPELGALYEQKKKDKEALEVVRKKAALKVQKYKSLIIPLTQKVAKEYLQDEYEDFSEIRVENGELVLDIFSHLNDWKELQKRKLAK